MTNSASNFILARHSLSEAEGAGASATLSEVRRRNRSNAHTLLAGEARVLRHYIALATISSTYAQGLLAQVPAHMAAREQRLRANSQNSADGLQAADANLAVEEIDTRLGKRHHSQIAQYCKVRTGGQILSCKRRGPLVGYTTNGSYPRATSGTASPALSPMLPNAPTVDTPNELRRSC